MEDSPGVVLENCGRDIDVKWEGESNRREEP